MPLPSLRPAQHIIPLASGHAFDVAHVVGLGCGSGGAGTSQIDGHQLGFLGENNSVPARPAIDAIATESAGETLVALASLEDVRPGSRH